MTEQGADDLFEHRNDPDEWDDQPVEIEVRPAGSEVVSFRLPSDELDRVQPGLDFLYRRRHLKPSLRHHSTRHAVQVRRRESRVSSAQGCPSSAR